MIIKLKKRNWIFRWLRKKLGIDSLAMEVYKNKDIKIDEENKKKS